MDLASIGYLDAVKAVKLRKEGVWVLLDMVVVVPEDFAEKFVFGVMNRFDNVLVVSGEIEEAATLSRGTELGQDVLAR
jgi:hypothetical protein